MSPLYCGPAPDWHGDEVDRMIAALWTMKAESEEALRYAERERAVFVGVAIGSTLLGVPIVWFFPMWSAVFACWMALVAAFHLALRGASEVEDLVLGSLPLLRRARQSHEHVAMSTERRQELLVALQEAEAQIVRRAERLLGQRRLQELHMGKRWPRC